MRILILTKDEYTDFISDVTLDFIIENDIEIGIDDFEPLDGEYVWEDNEGYDIGISFMYSYKVPKEQLENHTWINFHPGPLPMYKGRNLCYHAIMNGEEEFGATVHYMDENFDTGDIIEVVKFAIHDWDTAETLSDATINICKGLFMDYFPRIVAGEQFERIPNVDGNYYKKEPIEEFISASEAVQRVIRAITYKNFYPKVKVGGMTYKIVKDE